MFNNTVASRLLDRGVKEIPEMVLIEQRQLPDTFVRLLITAFGMLTLVIFLGMTSLLFVYVIFAFCLIGARKFVQKGADNPSKRNLVVILGLNICAALIFAGVEIYLWVQPGIETKFIAFSMIAGTIMFSTSLRSSARSLLMIEGTINTLMLLFISAYFLTSGPFGSERVAAGLTVLALGVYHWLVVMDLFRGITLTQAARERTFDAKRMESIGRLTGGIAHDFNNILTAVMGNLELYKEAKTQKEKDKLAAQSFEAAQRATELTSQLLSYSQRSQLQPKRLELHAFLQDFHFLASRVLSDEIDVKFNTHDGLWPVYIDQSRLENALLNLVINARDAMPNGGALAISATNFVLDTPNQGLRNPGPYVRIDVKDNGEGIQPEKVNLVFDPFYTTKEVGSGSGLGLSMTKGFAEQSGGALLLNSAPGVGTEVNLILPALLEE